VERLMSKREFLKKSLVILGGGLASLWGFGSLCGCQVDASTPAERPYGATPEPRAEVPFYRPLAEKAVQCEICFRRCVVKEDKLGFCRNKKNVGGRLYNLVYGHPCALQIDPIEKEPVFHMLPGSRIFCIGTASCNFRCKFCQNWEMSQRTMWELINYDITPEEVVDKAIENKCESVSFTYNEPIAFYEFMFDVARLARQKGLYAIFHTNGTLNPEPLFAILELMNAVTVDLKGFTTEFYRRYCEGELIPVLETLRNIRKTDTHLEIVNLVIPSGNDDLDDIRRMCIWIRDNLGDDVPLHFTRFFPAYKLQRLEATPIETLEAAARIADEVGLKFVYIGNVPGHRRNSTFCPRCGEALITRVHFAVLEMRIENGCCPFCGEGIPGIWSR